MLGSVQVVSSLMLVVFATGVLSLNPFCSGENDLTHICYRGEQVHTMCSMEELMPSLGTSVPSPSVLAVIICQSDAPLQNVGKIYSDIPNSPFPDEDFDSPFEFCDEPLLVSKTRLISISDDGKIWNWLLTAEGPEDTQKEDVNVGMVADASEVPMSGTNTNSIVSSKGGLAKEAGKQKENASGSRSRPANSISKQADMSFKVCLEVTFSNLVLKRFMATRGFPGQRLIENGQQRSPEVNTRTVPFIFINCILNHSGLDGFLCYDPLPSCN